LYFNTVQRIRECKENIEKTVKSVKGFLVENQTDPNSIIFRRISRWTRSVEEDSEDYRAIFLKSNSLLPSLDEPCRLYSESIDELNYALEPAAIVVNRPKFSWIEFPILSRPDWAQY